MFRLLDAMQPETRRSLDSIARHTAKRQRDIQAKRMKRAQERTQRAILAAERAHLDRLAEMNAQAEQRIAERKAAVCLTLNNGRVVRPIR